MGNIKKIIYGILRYLVLAVILGYGGWYAVLNYERFTTQAHFTCINITILIIFNVLTILCESVRFRIQIRWLGHDVGMVRSWYLFGSLQALNHLILKAGTFSTGYYLSRRYNISFHSYVAFMMTYIIVFVLASGLLGILISIIFMLAGITVNILIPAFFSAIVLFALGFIGAAKIKISLKRFPKIISVFLRSITEIYTDYKLIGSLVLVEMLYYLLCTARFMTAVTMFGSHINLLDGIVVTTVGNFLRVASIMPGGLGIAEFASGWTANILGHEFGLSGLSAGLDRLVYVVLIIVVGCIGFFTMSGRKEFHQPTELKEDRSMSHAMEVE
ncbi:MAG: flippase-like domain-containing protein [Candidatus Latescibacteria bacterium]|nr:flippase-like domain-containing protein [Candidatus Latescibacterota bacterium]